MLKVVRSVEDRVQLIHRKWASLDGVGKKYIDVRLEVALELKALKQSVENGEVGDEAALDWWEWYAANFVRSRSDAEKLLAIAGASNPPEAIAKRRGQEQVRSQVYRDRQETLRDVTQRSEPKVVARITPPPRHPSSPEDDRWLAQLMEAFEHLSWDGRVRALKQINELYQRWHRGEE